MEKIIDYVGIKIALKSKASFILEKIYGFLILGGCRECNSAEVDLSLVMHQVGDLENKKQNLLSGIRLLVRHKDVNYLKEIYVSRELIYFYFGIERVLFMFDRKRNILEGWVEKENIAADVSFLNVVIMDMLTFAMHFYGICFIHA